VFCATAFGLVSLHDPTLALLVAVCLAVATMAVKVLAVRRRRYAPPGIVARVDLEPAPPSAHPAAAAPAAAAPASAVGTPRSVRGAGGC